MLQVLLLEQYRVIRRHGHAAVLPRAMPLPDGGHGGAARRHCVIGRAFVKKKIVRLAAFENFYTVQYSLLVSKFTQYLQEKPFLKT